MDEEAVPKEDVFETVAGAPNPEVVVELPKPPNPLLAPPNPPLLGAVDPNALGAGFDVFPNVKDISARSADVQMSIFQMEVIFYNGVLAFATFKSKHSGAVKILPTEHACTVSLVSSAF